MTGTIDDVVAASRLVVCVGAGGVGKTTFAASLAARAAVSGRRVFALTVDPARRLADALGIAGVGDRAVRVALPDGARGTLDVAMLEASASFDALVARVALDDDHRRRILENRVYEAFSRTLARSHAYAAMERLHDVLERSEHDLVVLDTPPTRSALDVLDAPGSLARFADHRIVGVFVGGSALLPGAAAARRLFGLFSGQGLARELSEFLEAFVSLREGFAARARTMVARLRSADTAFVLVSAPEPGHLADAASLADGLAARAIVPRALVLNRAHVGVPERPGRPVGGVPSWDADELAARLALALDARRVLARAHAEHVAAAHENERLAAAAREFAARWPGSVPAWSLPRLSREPTSVGALLALADDAALIARDEAGR